MIKSLLIVNPRSAYCLRDLINPGQFIIVDGDSIEQLGNTVTCSILSVRPKAVSFKTGEPVAHYNHKEKVFQDIVKMATQNSGDAMYGAEVLVQIGNKQANLFLNSITLRKRAHDFVTCVNERAIISTEGVQIQNFEWYTVNLWVQASRVQTFKPVPDYGDYDEWYL